MLDGGYSPEVSALLKKSKWDVLKVAANKTKAKVGTIITRRQGTHATPASSESVVTNTPPSDDRLVPTAIQQTPDSPVIENHKHFSPPETLNLPPEFSLPLPEPEQHPVSSEFPTEPQAIMQYWKDHNSDYDYSSLNLTDDEIRNAVAWANTDWAREQGIKPEDLSPAQIVLGGIYGADKKTPAQEGEEMVALREKRIRDHQEKLLSILLPTQDTYIHATPAFENVAKIFENGLYAYQAAGLDGVAVQLRRKRKDGDEAIDKELLEKNIHDISHTHRGYRFVVVMDLPPLTPEQINDYNTKKSRTEHPSISSYFVKHLDKPVGAPGVTLMYDAVLPSEYIRGYIDLDTAQFHPKPLPSSSQ